jgi:tetratricopeptide (TPR) repeat protein
MVRWHQGRLAEMEPVMRRASERFPSSASNRSGLAFIFAESGELVNAKSEVDTLVRDDVSNIPNDFQWWLVTQFVARVCIAVKDHDRGSCLYDVTLPYAHLNASMSNSISFGSAHLILGQLAGLLERWPQAQAHFEHSLELNTRTGQRVWSTRTRQHYAELLLARDAVGDTETARRLLDQAIADAREIGMAGVVRDCERLLASKNSSGAARQTRR